MPAGGARLGSGRKPATARHKGAILKAERQIAKKLPDRIADLEYLAAGGYDQDTEVWEPAGLQTITLTRTAVDAECKEYTVSETVAAFPKLPPTQLVLVKKTKTVAAPDRGANIYLADRIMGKPVAFHDLDPQGTGAGLAVRIVDVDL